MKLAIIAAAIAIAGGGIYPDKALTPGAILTSDAPTVCRTGYAQSVRDVSAEKKALVYRRYGVPLISRDYVIDHFIPLELGGSNEIANLWPQAWPWYSQKDEVETYLYYQVCQGKMTLPEAQAKIAADWRALYPIPQ